MARRITTESIESPAKIGRTFEVFDFFFLLGYIFIAMALSAYVHDMLRIPYYIFSTIMAVFLTSKSIYNKHRRNFVSIYFMLMRDVAVYRPFYRNND